MKGALNKGIGSLRRTFKKNLAEAAGGGNPLEGVGEGEEVESLQQTQDGVQLTLADYSALLE